MVDSSLRHGDRAAVEKEVSAMFGDDLAELRSVCSAEMSSTGEYYVFVRCGDYRLHADKLRASSVVQTAVPSFDSPHMFCDSEVDEFAGSATRKEKPRELDRGDMVLVKEGYLKNLFGVVSGRTGPRRYRVVFSFYLRKFAENLSVTALEFVGNVFKRAGKARQTGAREAVLRNQLRRKQVGDDEGGAS